MKKSTAITLDRPMQERDSIKQMDENPEYGFRFWHDILKIEEVYVIDISSY